MLQSVAQIIQETLNRKKKKKKKELLLPAPDCCVPVCYRTAIIPDGALPTKRNETKRSKLWQDCTATDTGLEIGLWRIFL